MKKKIVNLLGIFSFLMFIFPVLVVAESEYDLGFKIYEYDPTVSTSAQDWYMKKFKRNDVVEISKGTQLDKGDLFIAGLYAISNSSTPRAEGFTIYCKYDLNVLEAYDNKIYTYIKSVDEGGVFPGEYETYWTKGALNSLTGTVGGKTVGKINIAFYDGESSPSSQMPFNNTSDQPFAFIIMKVKDDATAGEDIQINFITDPNETFHTMASTSGSDTSGTDITLNTIDLKDYVGVYKNSSSNTNLANITASGTIGSNNYDYTFTPVTEGGKTTGYTLTVPSGITTLNFSAGTEEPVRMITTDAPDITYSTSTGMLSGTIDVSTTKTFNVLVEAESGANATYTFTINTPSSDATLSSLDLSGVSGYSFNKDTLEYNLTVPYKTNSIDISATAASKATIASGLTTIDNDATPATGTETWSINTGANKKTIRVEAENCKDEYASIPGNTCTHSDYVLNITRSNPDTDSTLKNVVVTIDGTDTTINASDFDSSKTYTLDSVVNSITSISVVPTANSEYAKTPTVSSTDLKVGDNTITITVTAEDNTSTKYYLKIRRKSNVAHLSSMTITAIPNGGVLNETFAPSKNSYIYYYDEATTKITIEGTPISGASITGGLGDYDPADGSATINVTAEDGTTGTYTITFERKKSNVATLKTLSVKDKNGKEYITGSFSDTTPINITLENDIDSLTIAGTTTSSNVKSVTGLGEVADIGFTKLEKNIVVTAEDDSTKTYTLNITRKMSNNANLTDIKVSGVSIADFDKTNEGPYVLSPVGSNTSSLAITYTQENPYSTVKINSNNLTEGATNTVTVEVTSQDGTQKKNYKITAYRKSSKSTLNKALITSDPQGTKIFDGTNKYTYNYERSVEEVNIEFEGDTGSNLSILSPASSTLTIENHNKMVGTYRIEDGPITFTVTPEDGVLKTYTIEFKQLQDRNSLLSSLRIKNPSNSSLYTLSPVFQVTQTNYTLTIPSSESSVLIEATAQSAYAQEVQGTGEIAITSGTHDYYVTVVAEDGSKGIYTISITKPINASATLTDLKIDDATITGFSSTKTTYDYTVSSTKDKINLKVEPTAGATTRINDVETTETDITLDYGDNTPVIIKVKSEDNSSEETYRVNVHRQYNIAKITDLDVSSDPASTIKPGANEFTYTVDVPDEVQYLTLLPTYADGASLASATGLTAIDISDKTKNTITFDVKAEDPSIPHNTYTVNLNRLPSTNTALGSLTLTDKNGQPVDVTFDRTNNKYTATVKNSIDQVTLTTTKAHDGQTITGATGVLNLSNIGENTFNITVQAEDMNVSPVTYTLIINRSAEVSSINSITVLGKTPSWNETKERYEVSVDADTLTVGPSDVNLSLADGVSLVSKDSEKNLIAGKTEYKFKLDTDEGEKEYTIEITRTGSTDNTITLTTDVGTITQDTTTKDYKIVLPEGTKEFTLSGTPTFSRATITGGLGKYTLPVTGNKTTISVQPEVGNIKIYTLTIEEESSVDPTSERLAKLSVKDSANNEYITSFNPDTEAYSVLLKNEVTSLTIEATASASATIKMGKTSTSLTTTSTYNLTNIPEGTSSFIINVTNGSKSKTYTLNIVRSVPEVSEKLNILSVKDTKSKEYITSFSPDKETYEVKISNETNALIIEAQGTSTGTIKMGTTSLMETNMYTLNDIKEGETTFKVETTNGDKTKTYTIKITRETLPTSEKLNSLSVKDENGLEYITGFDRDKDTYNITLNKDVTKLTFKASGESRATIHIGPNTSLVTGGSYTLDDIKEGTTPIKVEVFNGGKTKTYIINVTKTDEDTSGIKLTNLNVKDKNNKEYITSFDRDKDTYDVTIDNDITGLIIEAYAETGDTIEIGKDTMIETPVYTYNDIEEGTTTVTVKVSNDTDAKNYKINITRKTKDATELDEITSDIHTVDDDYIREVEPTDKGITLKDELTNDNAYLKIYKKDGVTEVGDDETLATGMIVKLIINDEEKDRKFIVIKGDTDGDGKITTHDGVKVLRHSLGYFLEGPYEQAAYVDKDTNISTNDGVKILSHVLGFANIYEEA